MATRTRRPPEEVGPDTEQGQQATEAAAAAAGEVISLDSLRAALEADERPVERVVVHEWAGAPVFYLRGLTGRDRDTIENTTYGESLNDISARIVARALVTPDGKRLAVDRKAVAEVEAMLTSRSAGGLLHLQRVARRLSGLDQTAVDELEAMLSKAPSAADGSG